MADSADIDYTAPSSPRIWNYWQGGKDYYAVDRAAGDEWVALQPEIVQIAKESRQLLMRAVHYLAAEAGVRQFLDIGTGLPTLQNTHEVAQAAAPESRIVYVDNDPLVLSHARALMTNTSDEGVTAYVDADYHEPEVIIADARSTLNFTQPIAVMFMGVLGHVPEYEEALSIARRVMAAVPSGSYLVLWENTNLSETARKAAEEYAKSGAIPYRLCSVEQVATFFDGLELVGPGLTSINQWRPGADQTSAGEPLDAYCAIGRKP
ncbi:MULTISPECIES: SAM-dependent methyltransferase [Saccharopolyspora]|uniref:SAM-dependent methyltransferase n=1 Tax=Saccharopolyspora elongata TaxID=2530387 RepID=A0A4R4YCR8_9PSEU|nr:SAM-dependent methyltransferase [Saccharopolyspora elongata]TDD40972.1 SAM-dependent methyltransferase [Saccharopolyspora elongata]